MLHPPGLLQSVPLTPWQATVDPRLCQRLPNTHRQAWLSLLWGHCSFLLGPGEHKVLSVPSKSLCFLVLWKFCNQIPLTFKVRFPGGFSVPLPDPQVGKSVVGLRTSATVWELIWCNCAPVCELPGWWLCCGANGDFLQENLGHMPCHPGPCPSGMMSMPLHETLKHSKARLAQSFVEVTAPFPGSWLHTRCMSRLYFVTLLI